ncbi:hypothetical protein [Sphingopyxis macrogoltabida]|nr:hypothetical protein [Sphingopyxis macrogoltabida]
MNVISKAVIALAATSLAAAPIAASAAPATMVEGVRATSTTEDQSEFNGDSTWLYVLLALAAVIGVVLLLDDNDDPVSA